MRTFDFFIMRYSRAMNFKMADVSSLLKVLVIHGYRQSAKSSHEKTGSFRKGLKKYCEFVYITAPNKIQSEDETENNEEYGWWFSKNNDGRLSFSSKEESDIDPGHETSIQLVKNAFEKQGPFDGVIGFSQGATFVAHLCALREKDEKFNFKFAILFAGFKSRSSVHQKYYIEKISCPTLHVYGDTDKVIPKEMSMELQGIFEDSTVLNHTGGHYIPATAAERKTYQSFLDRFKKN